MTEDEIIQQLREMRYPNDIDVTGAVIARISKTPLLASAPTKPPIFKRVVAAVAACAVLVVAVNAAILFTHDYNESSIGNMISEVYTYHADYNDLTASISDYDIGAIESYYEELE